MRVFYLFCHWDNHSIVIDQIARELQITASVSALAINDSTVLAQAKNRNESPKAVTQSTTESEQGLSVCCLVHHVCLAFTDH